VIEILELTAAAAMAYTAVKVVMIVVALFIVFWIMEE